MEVTFSYHGGWDVSWWEAVCHHKGRKLRGTGGSQRSAFASLRRQIKRYEKGHPGWAIEDGSPKSPSGGAS